MQLPMPLDVLVPLAIGVLVVVVAIVVLVRGLRRSPDETAATPAVPGFSDWTGEHVGESGIAPGRAAGPVTVAEAVAVREAAPARSATVTYAERRPAGVATADRAPEPDGSPRVDARPAGGPVLTWPWSTAAPGGTGDQAGPTGPNRPSALRSTDGAGVTVAVTGPHGARPAGAAAPPPAAESAAGERPAPGPVDPGVPGGRERPASGPVDAGVPGGRGDTRARDGERGPHGGSDGTGTSGADAPRPATGMPPGSGGGVPAQGGRPGASHEADGAPAERRAPGRRPGASGEAHGAPVEGRAPGRRTGAGAESRGGVPAQGGRLGASGEADSVDAAMPPGSGPGVPAQGRRVRGGEIERGAETPDGMARREGGADGLRAGTTGVAGPGAPHPADRGAGDAAALRRAAFTGDAPAPGGAEGTDAGDPRPGRHQERRVDGRTPAGSADGHPAGEPPASTAGASPTVAAAVAQALAVRAASMTPADPARGEARDRLLAVLLDDPARAVGATMDLAACQDQLTRLSGAVREGRARLGEAIVRLAGAGLTPEQLARLSGLSDDEVRALLA